MTETETDYCDQCQNGAKLPPKHGVWTCTKCLREFDNRSEFQLWIARLEPYAAVLAAWLLPGAIAVVIGRTTWDLTWSDTFDFAGIAVIIMFFAGTFGASVQAHFLGSDLRGGKSVGQTLLDSQPFVFYAPWVLVSLLAAALAMEHGPGID